MLLMLMWHLCSNHGRLVAVSASCSVQAVSAPACLVVARPMPVFACCLVVKLTCLFV